jgi:hypothetical protein
LFRPAVGHLVVVLVVVVEAAGKVSVAAVVVVALEAAASLSLVDGKARAINSSQDGDSKQLPQPLDMEHNQDGEIRIGLNKVTNSSNRSKEAGARYVFCVSPSTVIKRIARKFCGRMLLDC